MKHGADRQLTDTVYQLNNQGKYVASVQLIHTFLNTKNRSEEEIYNAYLNLSETHKRLFDYEKVLQFLDSALTHAKKITSKPQYYVDNINCRKAFALFDIQKYGLADLIMSDIEKHNYINIDEGDKAYLIMQRGYLLQLDKQYKKAEQKYDEAIDIMRVSTPCNLPVIYVKKISLYGYLKDANKMQKAYQMAVWYADSCKIIKYHLYATEVMRNTYKTVLKDYKNAFFYFDRYDSLNTIYNADAFKSKLNELEIKYETEKKENALKLSYETILSNQRMIVILILALVGTLLTIALTVIIYRRKKIAEREKQTLLFTKALLNKTEEERRRIAADLHDSVNNELLLIKSNVGEKPQEIKSQIDRLIDHVRVISRNLHPVMFEEMGLQDSVEQLAERVQQHNNFILSTEIIYKAGSLSVGDEMQLYRIIQEAVNNMIKYSNAVAGLISLRHEGKQIILEIKDNGIGFNVEEKLKSRDAFGLHNIMERSRMIGGEAKITSGKTGTNIFIKV